MSINNIPPFAKGGGGGISPGRAEANPPMSPFSKGDFIEAPYLRIRSNPFKGRLPAEKKKIGRANDVVDKTPGHELDWFKTV